MRRAGGLFWPDLSARCRNAHSRRPCPASAYCGHSQFRLRFPVGAAIVLWLQSARNAGLLASAYAVELPGNAGEAACPIDAT